MRSASNLMSNAISVDTSVPILKRQLYFVEELEGVNGGMGLAPALRVSSAFKPYLVCLIQKPNKLKMGSNLMLCSILVICLAIGWYAIFGEKPLGPLPNVEDEWWGEGERKKENADVRPFIVDVPSEVLFDLKKRLKSTRYFNSLEDSEWEYGTKPEYMKEVVNYWLNKYSWLSHQSEINKYPHFKTDIDGISLHFIHVKPDKTKTKGTYVCPLLLLHGWPGSFYEFHKIIPLFTKVDEEIAFEVVVPSLPGYGFSSAARKKGQNAIHVAKIMHKLMTRVGFEKYYVQAGDFGSEISKRIALLFPKLVTYSVFI